VKKYNNRVAIVDDVSDIHQIYSLILKRHGYGVVLSISSGIEIIKDTINDGRQVDFIIMDYLMPGINELEAARQILA
jgi:CheY-like chemotaxis protein